MKATILEAASSKNGWAEITFLQGTAYVTLQDMYTGGFRVTIQQRIFNEVITHHTVYANVKDAIAFVGEELYHEIQEAFLAADEAQNKKIIHEMLIDILKNKIAKEAAALVEAVN